MDHLLNSLPNNSSPLIDINVIQGCAKEMKTIKWQVTMACVGSLLNKVVYNYWFIFVYCLLL